MGVTLSDADRRFKDQSFAGDIYAKMMHPDGRPYHTFRTATVIAEGDRCVFDRCAFENNAGPGKEVGQAVALYVDANDNVFNNCVIRGHQDTLFLAPLPPKEFEKDGFLGPKQFAPRTDRTVKFNSCRIEGGVDFVFGGATAYFENCDFISNEPGFVFAPSTPQHVDVGFVCNNCRFLRTQDVPDDSVFIARPWRDYGKVRLNSCYLDSHINPLGFDDWNKPDARRTVVFEEYNSTGPGALKARRPDWVRYEP